MDSGWVSAMIAAVAVTFAIYTWAQRRIDDRKRGRREELHRIADALQALSRDGYAHRYQSPNSLYTTQLYFRGLVNGSALSLPACRVLAAAKDDLEIEQLEKAAFDEIAAALRTS